MQRYQLRFLRFLCNFADCTADAFANCALFDNALCLVCLARFSRLEALLEIDCLGHRRKQLNLLVRFVDLAGLMLSRARLLKADLTLRCISDLDQRLGLDSLHPWPRCELVGPKDNVGCWFLFFNPVLSLSLYENRTIAQHLLLF